jgi:hypothetical protein
MLSHVISQQLAREAVTDRRTRADAERRSRAVAHRPAAPRPAAPQPVCRRAAARAWVLS